MASTIKPEWFIYAALVLPVVADVMDWNIPLLGYVGAGLLALYEFNENFINKDQVTKKPPADLGQPQRPMIPSKPSWEFDENGQPRRTYSPPAPPRPPTGGN